MMLDRCENPKNMNYNHYGERGITVCEKWHDFWNFAKWCDSQNYNDSLTLDRINVDGNYEPKNCRFTTWDVQSNNKRTCIYITYKGETKTLNQWSKITGINCMTLKNRFHSGWDTEKMLTLKPKIGNNQHKIS